MTSCGFTDGLDNVSMRFKRRLVAQSSVLFFSDVLSFVLFFFGLRRDRDEGS